METNSETAAVVKLKLKQQFQKPHVIIMLARFNNAKRKALQILKYWTLKETDY